MIEEFSKFAGNRIIAFLLKNPGNEMGINGIARELNLSPGSIKRYVDILVKDDLAEIKKTGNIHQPQLKYDHALVKEMKKTYSLLLLFESGVQDIADNITSTALYGSFASGTYDEKSDIDILIITDNKELNSGIISEIEKNFNRELQATIIPYYKWETMKAKNHDFATSILKNHILLTGAEL